jgi:hypothetical protein
MIGTVNGIATRLIGMAIVLFASTNEKHRQENRDAMDKNEAKPLTRAMPLSRDVEGFQ